MFLPYKRPIMRTLFWYPNGFRMKKKTVDVRSNGVKKCVREKVFLKENKMFFDVHANNELCYTDVIAKESERMNAQEVIERMRRDGSDIVFQYDGLESGVTMDVKDGYFELTAWNGAWYRSYDAFEDAFTDTAIFKEGLGSLIDEGKIRIFFE